MSYNRFLFIIIIIITAHAQEYLDCDGESCEITEETNEEQPYGSCSTNSSLPAHGPDDLGCCAASEFQCCADNVKAASGPYGEGCSCEDSQFGCCPDDATPAKGPDLLGCGCQFSAFGCCPDSTSEAGGANFTGCPCHTFEHGCCPDGINVAHGPNLEGCICNGTYGCCPDGLTPKVTERSVTILGYL